MTAKNAKNTENPHPAADSTGLLSLRQTLAGLRYIAGSPAQKWGGFHPRAVLTAKAALYHIARIKTNRGQARREKI